MLCVTGWRELSFVIVSPDRFRSRLTAASLYHHAVRDQILSARWDAALTKLVNPNLEGFLVHYRMIPLALQLESLGLTVLELNSGQHLVVIYSLRAYPGTFSIKQSVSLHLLQNR